jgi:steroid delta-isomerase-like uncharacterized protein
MKNILIFCILLSSVVFAQEVKVGNILEKYMQAWNEHDRKKIETFYAQNVIWYDLGYDYETKGKKKVSKAITEAFLSNVDGMYWVKSGDVFTDGDTVIYEWVYGGKFHGIFDGKEIQNKAFSIKGISTTTVDKNGKIASQKDYYDLFNFRKQLGLE